MKFLKSHQLRDVATLTTATLATLTLASTNPAISAIITIPFCGFFGGDTTGASGRVLPGSFITLDTEKTTQADNFGILDAQVSTTRGPNPTDDLRTYTFSDFMPPASQGTSIPGVPTLPEESIAWKFMNPLQDKFYIVFPKSGYDLLPTELRRTFDITNYECRVNEECLPEPDKRVPEPTGVLGTAIALGLGGLLTKKNLSKLKKDNEAA